MKILVDADACPVKDIIVEIAKEYKLEVIMVTDTSHILETGYAKVITVDKERDSADFVIIGLSAQGDVVITQDYGLAAMALSKNCSAINNNGYEYTPDNIDRLLFERHISREARKIKKSVGKIKKRTPEDNLSFKKGFIRVLEKLL